MELGLAEEVSWAGERARSNLSVGSAGELVRRMVVVVVVVGQVGERVCGSGRK